MPRPSLWPPVAAALSHCCSGLSKASVCSRLWDVVSFICCELCGHLMRASDANHSSGTWGLEFSSDKTISFMCAGPSPPTLLKQTTESPTQIGRSRNTLLGMGHLPLPPTIYHSKSLPCPIKVHITTYRVILGL